VDPDLDARIYTLTTFHLYEPSVGYMVVDNLELGVDFGISNT
jgi:hypothetical protein